MLTWKQFLEKAKAVGIKDDDEIAYIDIDEFWDFEFHIEGTGNARRVEVH